MGNKPKLLLHTCCADCALQFIGNIAESTDCKKSLDKGLDFDITLYFDNNNIHPRSEYLARLEAVKHITKDSNFKLIVADWKPKDWYLAIEQNSDNTNARRCIKCWQHRLNNTFESAEKNDFNYFSTTLLTSHYQNREQIEDICKKIETKSMKFLNGPENFKEIETSGFYKQNYCGCIYSLVNRMEAKWNQ